MSRLERRFARLREEGRRAFIPYVAAGDPSLEVTERLVVGFAEVGADVVELGVPFSDPIADGPSIEAATQRALAHGVSLPKILETVARLRSRTDIPLLLMGYYNPFFCYGVERFCEEAQRAGVDGIVVPDLPPEEAEELLIPARKSRLATIFLVAPTSPPERIRLVSEVTRGFLYVVSLTGVTGARRVLSEDLLPTLKRVRSVTDKPVCVGFGVSTSEHAREVASLADGVIVGSAVVDTMARHLDNPDRLVVETVGFVSQLVAAVRSVRGRFGS